MRKVPNNSRSSGGNSYGGGWPCKVENAADYDTGDPDKQGKARLFIMSHGGSGFIIRSIEGTHGSAASREPATEPQWVAWMAYFEAKGIPHALAKSRGMTTVPCEWPEDFDIECGISDRRATLPRRRAPDHGERDRVLAGLKRLATMVPAIAERMDVTDICSGRSASFRKPKDPRAPAQTRSLDDIAREYASAPVTLSSEALVRPQMDDAVDL